MRDAKQGKQAQGLGHHKIQVGAVGVLGLQPVLDGRMLRNGQHKVRHRLRHLHHASVKEHALHVQRHLPLCQGRVLREHPRHVARLHSRQDILRQSVAQREIACCGALEGVDDVLAAGNNERLDVGWTRLAEDELKEESRKDRKHGIPQSQHRPRGHVLATHDFSVLGCHGGQRVLGLGQGAARGHGNGVVRARAALDVLLVDVRDRVQQIPGRVSRARMKDMVTDQKKSDRPTLVCCERRLASGCE